jgi:hypothetical protein
MYRNLILKSDWSLLMIDDRPSRTESKGLHVQVHNCRSSNGKTEQLIISFYFHIDFGLGDVFERRTDHFLTSRIEWYQCTSRIISCKIYWVTRVNRIMYRNLILKSDWSLLMIDDRPSRTESEGPHVQVHDCRSSIGKTEQLNNSFHFHIDFGLGDFSNVGLITF